ncbi:MAG TPA: class I SAM-dependent methyltransferase [Levilinea sp.]|nr:class I SAM-dependent methyltransferase [Levilinea sp.]
MHRNTDSYYLHYEQYREASKHRNRVQLHEKYRTYQYPWLLWVFDQLELQPGMRILEFSSGSGAIWMHNFKRLPDKAELILSDPSIRMMKTIQDNLRQDGRFRYLVADIQDAPLMAGQFDVVMANHMLYRVPDLERAIHSIHRVMKPGGVLFATTNGLRHMYNVFELIQQVAPSIRPDTRAAERFGLHNAPQKLAPAFSHTNVTVYPDFLWVTETEPLMQYIRSLWVAAQLSEAQMMQLAEVVASLITSEGGIHINKSSGLVKARRI